MYKKCSHCGKVLSEDNFYHSPRSVDGLQYYCKSCAKIAREKCRNDKIERYRLSLRKNHFKRTAKKENIRQSFDVLLFVNQFDFCTKDEKDWLYCLLKNVWNEYSNYIL